MLLYTSKSFLQPVRATPVQGGVQILHYPAVFESPDPEVHEVLRPFTLGQVDRRSSFTGYEMGRCFLHFLLALRWKGWRDKRGKDYHFLLLRDTRSKQKRVRRYRSLGLSQVHRISGFHRGSIPGMGRFFWFFSKIFLFLYCWPPASFRFIGDPVRA